VNNYYISSVFGNRLHPVYGYWRMHNGIDMACAQGTPIYASRGALVEVSVYSSSAGNYVQINHGDGYRSVYMHMTHYIVYAGQYVQAGQVIGYVGSTGASTGPHLHWGVSYNGVYFNPYPLIS
jgi:murein DD-endopeptidase MepM/ murein hydrolase activator NlpD